MTVRDVLSQPERDWRPEPPASEIELARLIARAPVRLPSEYLELLRLSNGGEGPLGLAPRWLRLYPVAECLETWGDDGLRELYPGFLFFAGNGGLEWIGFDLRGEALSSIVMMDPIAGPESARQIARDMTELIDAIGVVTPPR